MLTHPTNPDYLLVEPLDLQSEAPPIIVQKNREALSTIVNWADQFLSHPHPELGRDGNVCPFVKPSLEKRQFWLAVYPDHDISLEEICHIMLSYRDWFFDIEPREEKDAQYSTFLILFPGIPQAQAEKLIWGAQARLKPEFVVKGLMIGEFYATSPKPGLWNADFYPLRSPLPLIAIRRMVPSDIAFLKEDMVGVTAYLHFFSHRLPKRLMRVVAETVQALGMGQAQISGPPSEEHV